MSIAWGLGLVLLTVVLLEGWAWVVHKYLLHGPLWFLHKSHHRPRQGWWEHNDWVAVFYAALSAAGIILGDLYNHWVLYVGIGIAVYGVLYFLLHDVLVHQRIKLRYRVRSGYLQRLIRAHKIHHKQLARTGSQAFGFLYAAPKYKVKRSNR